MLHRKIHQHFIEPQWCEFINAEIEFQKILTELFCKIQINLLLIFSDLFAEKLLRQNLSGTDNYFRIKNYYDKRQIQQTHEDQLRDLARQKERDKLQIILIIKLLISQ